MLDLSKEAVLVTGGDGFLGRKVVAALRGRGLNSVAAPTHAEYDLIDEDDAYRAFEVYRPTVVIHLAAIVGGIRANMDAPVYMFSGNMDMGANVLHNAWSMGCKRTVLVGTTCSYPRDCTPPFKEADLWSGYPEATNAPYGIAKKALGVLLDAYHRQYGMSAAYVIPTNLYGPGDNFDPKTSHVIPAMIRRFAQAKVAGAPSMSSSSSSLTSSSTSSPSSASSESSSSTISCWGSGNCTRDFLYVEDCAEAIVRAAERIDDPQPINLGTGREVTIKNVAEQIARIVGYDGAIEWDMTKPDGQPRRSLDTTRARELLGWEATTDMTEGLRRTVGWWLENRS